MNKILATILLAIHTVSWSQTWLDQVDRWTRGWDPCQNQRIQQGYFEHRIDPQTGQGQIIQHLPQSDQPNCARSRTEYLVRDRSGHIQGRIQLRP
jgi:hypothetical protein